MIDLSTDRPVMFAEIMRLREERDSLAARVKELEAKWYQSNRDLHAAWARAEAAERVAEAAASLYAEQGVLDAVSHFNVAWILKDRLETWRQTKPEPGP